MKIVIEIGVDKHCMAETRVTFYKDGKFVYSFLTATVDGESKESAMLKAISCCGSHAVDCIENA